MNYKDVAITDLIEWWSLIPITLGIMLWGIYSRVHRAPDYKEAGSNTMADGKIKSLLSGGTKAAPAETKTISMTELLARKADTVRATEASQRASVESHTAAAAAAQAKADEATAHAAAIEQAKAILDQAGVTI